MSESQKTIRIVFGQKISAKISKDSNLSVWLIFKTLSSKRFEQTKRYIKSFSWIIAILTQFIVNQLIVYLKSQLIVPCFMQRFSVFNISLV